MPMKIPKSLIASFLLSPLLSVHPLEAQDNTDARGARIFEVPRAQQDAREDAQAKRQASTQERREDLDRKGKQVIFWFSTISAVTIGSIFPIFFLVFRARRAKAIRLQHAPLNDLWSLPHLKDLESNSYDIWVLSPPMKMTSSYWTLRSRQDGSVFGLRILGRGRITEWEGNGPKVHFFDTQDITRVGGPIEVVVDGEHRFPIERTTQLLGLSSYRFNWREDSYQVSFERKKDRMELHRNGGLYAVSDSAAKNGPRVIAAPKDTETALLLIFSYVVLLR